MKNKILSLITVFMLCTNVFISNSVAMNLVKEDIYNEETGEFVVLKDLVSENKEDSITLKYADKLTQTSSSVHFMEEDNYKQTEIKKTENAKLYNLYLKLINEMNKKAKNEKITTDTYLRPSGLINEDENKFYSINFDKSINLQGKHYGLENFYIEVSTKKCWDIFSLVGHGEDVLNFYTFYTLTDEEMNLLKTLLPYEKENKVPTVNQNVEQNKEDKKPVINSTENKVDDKKDTSKVEDLDSKIDEKEETQLKEDSEKVEENEDKKDNDIEENTNEEQIIKESKNYIPIIFPIVIIVMLVATGLFLYFYNKK